MYYLFVYLYYLSNIQIVKIIPVYDFRNAIIRRANFCKKYNTQLIYYSFQRGISLRVLRTCTIKMYSSKVDICNVEKFRFKILEAIKLFNQPKIGILRGVSTK